MNFPGNIAIGSTNKEAVKAIKIKLNALGMSYTDPDNPSFGDVTYAAVIQFQRSKQLLQDGVVGELTWSKMFDQTPVALYTGPDIALTALTFALKDLNVRELTGNNDGKEVEAYLATVGLLKGQPWCMSFVFANFSKAADQLTIKNPMYKTGHVLTQWNNTPALNRVYSNPRPGDIFIMSFGGGTGHTGHVNKVIGDRIWTVEGNTNMHSSRDGDGVYERSRTISSINKGFIRY